MSYLVLARKWRPTNFKELVGQQHVVQTLSNAIATGRVHHAFLFTGCRGVGKTSAARILAKALNCEEGLSVNPCGKCTNCIEISEGSSPDVYEIDGASNTSVDNIRELRESVRYLPAKSRFKIYIIDEVHMLSTSAFNALLKTLEEPPPHVKFIFATTEPQKIPITILSRCQRFDFRRVPGSEMLARLTEMMQAEKINIGSDALRVIIRESQGSMRDAQSLLEQAIAFCGDDLSEERVIEAIGAVDRHYVEEALIGIVERKPERAIAAINYVYGAGHDLVDFTSLLAEQLRDLAVISAGLPMDQLERSESELATMRRLAQAAGPIDLQRFFSFISATIRELRNAPIPKLILDMAILRCSAVEHTNNLSAILNELRSIYAGAPVKPSVPDDYTIKAPPIAPMPAEKSMEQEPPKVIAKPELPKTKPAEIAVAVQPPLPPSPPSPPPPAAPELSAPASMPPEEEPPHPADSYILARESVAPPASPVEVPQKETAKEQFAPMPQAPALNPGQEGPSWADFVKQLNNYDPALAPVLEHAYLNAFTPDVIQLCFKGNDFYRSYLAAPEHMKKARDFAEKYFKHPIKIEIVNELSQNAEPPLCEQASAKAKNRLREMHQKAAGDARIKAVVEILDGSLESIKML